MSCPPPRWLGVLVDTGIYDPSGAAASWHRYHVGNVGENQPFSWATVLPLVPGLLWQFRLFVDQLAVAHPARAGWFEETIIMILHPDQDPLHRPVS